MKNLSLLMAFVATLTPAQVQGPHIVFDSTDHDYGRVKQYTEIDYSFRFTNKGNELLVIEKVESG